MPTNRAAIIYRSKAESY